MYEHRGVFMLHVLLRGTVLGLVVGGCGHPWDTPMPRDVGGYEEDLSLEGDTSDPVTTCSLSDKTGCFEGSVAPAPYLYVNGKEFLDAADFSARLGHALKGESNDETAAYVTEYVANSALDNRSFLRGFQVHAKSGGGASVARILSNGSFMLHFLDPGVYEARVSRQLRIVERRTARAQLAAPVDPAKDQAAGVSGPEVTEKAFCALLFSETSFEITKRRKTEQTFDDFRLILLNDGECALGA